MTAPLLELAGLSVQARGREGLRTLLDGIDLDIARGETIGVVGESGSGKTLLARALLGLLPSGMTAQAERARFDGRELPPAGAADWAGLRGQRIGYVLQEPLLSLNPSLTVGTQLTEALIHHRALSRREAEASALRMIESVQLDDSPATLRRYPHEFSGGQRQRLLIASVLLLQPTLVIADEPATALDPLVGHEVLDLLCERAPAVGAALLLISHDLAQVARRSQRVLVLEQGRVVERGATERVLAAPAAEYTRRLLEAAPQAKATLRARPSTAAFVTAECVTVRHARRTAWSWRSAPSRAAVEDVSFELRRGETLAVIGESGSGKSSLALTVLGLLENAGGTLTVDGLTWAQRTAAQRRELRRRIGVIFQDPSASLDPRLRIGAIIDEALRGRGMTRAQRDESVARVTVEVGLGQEHLGRFAHQLSGGQRQRVAIARALVGRPELVIADEPVSALDTTVQAQIIALLERLQAQYGFALMFISHDLTIVQRIADQVLVLRDGRTVEAAPAAELFTRPQTDYVRALLAVVPRLTPDGAGFRLEPQAWGMAG